MFVEAIFTQKTHFCVYEPIYHYLLFVIWSIVLSQVEYKNYAHEFVEEIKFKQSSSSS